MGERPVRDGAQLEEFLGVTGLPLEERFAAISDYFLVKKHGHHHKKELENGVCFITGASVNGK